MVQQAYVDALRETDRLAALKDFAILDTPHEREFDAVVLLAEQLLGVPMALVSLVDDHRQWFKARRGLAVTETPRDVSFCAHALEAGEIMIVEDATLDPRFVDNPLVTGAPHIRFYAGVPLRPHVDDASCALPGIGTLCVLDTKPRRLSQQAIKALGELAAIVSALIRARASAATAQRLGDEARRHAAVLERQQLQLSQAERMAGLGSWRLDLADGAIHWSDQVYAIHGLPIGRMPSVEDALTFYPVERRGEIATLLALASELGTPFDFESDFRTADGRERRVRSMGEAQLVDGRPISVIGVFQDITDRHAREQSLKRTANTDALTSLPNRAAFEKRLAGTLAQAQAQSAPTCLLLFDLDGFKGVNDSFGHAVGDEVLRVIAERLRAIAYDRAFAARLGGDEFVMLVTRPRDCQKIESFIADALARLRYEVEQDGERRKVSATIGAAFAEPGQGSAGDLMRRADIALYAAKRDQRGTARIAGEAVRIEPSDAVAAA